MFNIYRCFFLANDDNKALVIVPGLGVEHEVRRPRTQVEEGPKPRYTNPRSYSLLGISKLIRRET